MERGQADVWERKNGRDLTLKANEIINISNSLDQRGRPADVAIWGAHRVGEGKYVFDVNSPVAANWLKSKGNRENFAQGLAEGAIVVLRSHPVLIKYVPITFDVDNEDLKEIVKKTHGDPEQVLGARWVKDPNRRGQNQKVAFLIADLKSPEAANAIIAEGAYIHGKRCEAKKFLTDPQRCNKCQRYGHVTAICRSETPRCSYCAKEHWSSQCNQESDNFHCANCNKTGHSTRDNECPSLHNRIKMQDERNPDRKLIYYPTIEAWTHELNTEYKAIEAETNDNGNRSRKQKDHL